MSDPVNGNVRVAPRRRRTRRHRKNRLIRRVLTLVLVLVVAAAASVIALQYLSPSLFRAQSTPIFEQSTSSRSGEIPQMASQAEPSRLVYPYSIVPGGVENAKELKWVADHDPVVAAHYAGFDYARAQVVRLTLDRTVYLSYRIGNHIYWTRRRIALHKGEKLITDGKITARTRCGNQVTEKPQQEAASPAEPPPQKFDEPVRFGSGTAMRTPPVTFESALNRPGAGSGPMGPLSLYDPLAGGSFISIAPPPLPEALCSPLKRKKGSGFGIDETKNGKKKTVGPCGNGGSVGTVPEPGTWILFISGFAFLMWQAQRKSARA